MVVYRQKFRLQLGGIVVQDSRVVYFRKESHAIIRLKVFRFLSRETHGLGDLFLAHEGTAFRHLALATTSFFDILLIGTLGFVTLQVCPVLLT